jgi:hypothetical protein
MHNPDSLQITFANYALPIGLQLAGSAQEIASYTSDIGADNLLVMPMRTRLTRELLSNGRETQVGVVRQTYRGERNLQQVFDWLNAEGLTPQEQINKFKIALKSYLAMRHKDDSLDSVEHMASQHHSADIMYEFTGQSIQSARRVAAWEREVSQRRIIQLTKGNLDLLIGDQEPTRPTVERALFDNGFTHLGFHSDSSPEVFHDNTDIRLRTLAPLIMQYELTAFRTDLIDGIRDDKDIERLVNGDDSRTAQTIRELRDFGAPIQRIVYAIPGNHSLHLEDCKAVVANLRQI